LLLVVNLETSFGTEIKKFLQEKVSPITDKMADKNRRNISAKETFLLLVITKT